MNIVSQNPVLSERTVGDTEPLTLVITRGAKTIKLTATREYAEHQEIARVWTKPMPGGAFALEIELSTRPKGVDGKTHGGYVQSFKTVLMAEEADLMFGEDDEQN